MTPPSGPGARRACSACSAPATSATTGRSRPCSAISAPAPGGGRGRAVRRTRGRHGAVRHARPSPALVSRGVPDRVAARSRVAGKVPGQTRRRVPRPLPVGAPARRRDRAGHGRPGGHAAAAAVGLPVLAVPVCGPAGCSGPGSRWSASAPTRSATGRPGLHRWPRGSPYYGRTGTTCRATRCGDGRRRRADEVYPDLAFALPPHPLPAPLGRDRAASGVMDVPRHATTTAPAPRRSSPAYVEKMIGSPGLVDEGGTGPAAHRRPEDRAV